MTISRFTTSQVITVYIDINGIIISQVLTINGFHLWILHNNGVYNPVSEYLRCHGVQTSKYVIGSAWWVWKSGYCSLCTGSWRNALGERHRFLSIRFQSIFGTPQWFLSCNSHRSQNGHDPMPRSLGTTFRIPVHRGTVIDGNDSAGFVLCHTVGGKPQGMSPRSDGGESWAQLDSGHVNYNSHTVA